MDSFRAAGGKYTAGRGILAAFRAKNAGDMKSNIPGTFCYSTVFRLSTMSTFFRRKWAAMFTAAENTSVSTAAVT